MRSPQMNMEPESSLLTSSRPQIDRILKEHVFLVYGVPFYGPLPLPVLTEGWLFPLHLMFAVYVYLGGPRRS